MKKPIVLYLQKVLEDAYRSAMKKDLDTAMCSINHALEVIETGLNNKKENGNERNNQAQ